MRSWASARKFVPVVSSLGSDRRVVECFLVVPWDLERASTTIQRELEKRIVYSSTSRKPVVVYYYWLSQFEIKVVKNKAARRQLSSSTSITYVCKVCKTNLSRRRWYMFKVELKRSSEEIIRQDRKIASLLHNDTKKLIYCKHFLIRISKIFFGTIANFSWAKIFETFFDHKL